MSIPFARTFTQNASFFLQGVKKYDTLQAKESFL
nr:MAG TPA: hypothetical protein [Caudoviricetes sp.]DAW91130.1 MAG TPA: hypothetical protein [Caudoviricetes sp.]